MLKSNHKADSSEKASQDLRLLPCLLDLTDDEIATLEKAAQTKSFGKNEIIFEEAEEARSFFILLHGSVRLYKTSEDGKEMVIKIMEPGEYFCFVPLSSAAKYPVNAMAMETSSALMISCGSFKDFMCSGLSKTGLKVLCNMCSKIAYLNGLIEDLSFKDVEQRVALALLRLADNKSPFGNNAIIKVSHQQVALLVGTAREVVSRTLSKFRKEGIVVDSHIKQFTVDKARLKKFIGDKSDSKPAMSLPVMSSSVEAEGV